MPISATNPIAAETLNAVPVIYSMRMPPMSAIGMTLAANSISTTELKFTYSSRHMSMNASGTTMDSRAIASCKLPNSPTHSIW